MELRTGFGWVEINGERYNYDVVLFWDREDLRTKKEKSEKVKNDKSNN